MHHIGDDFDDFLKEEGMYEHCEETALKRVFKWIMKKLQQVAAQKENHESDT